MYISNKPQALKDQNDKDQSIVRLHQTMMKTYEAASEDDILKQYDTYRPVFDAMLGQSMECAVFISEYASKHYIGEFSGFFALTVPRAHISASKVVFSPQMLRKRSTSFVNALQTSRSSFMTEW